MSIEIRLLDQARRVLDRHIDATSHHMKIKASFGSEFKTVSIAEMRQALTDAAAVVEEERIEAAKQAERNARVVEVEAKEKKGAKKSGRKGAQEPMVRYADKIVSVAATSADGKKVTRVRIKCALPGCKHTREIATQDLFQVSHCSLAHKREHQKQA